MARYEEGTAGELVMQGPPEDGHTGRGPDRVGPCDYNPSIEAVKVSTVAKAAGWGRSRAARGETITKPKDTPGPGQYFSPAETPNGRAAGGRRPPGEHAKVKRSSNFASVVPRPFQTAPEPFDVTPGPGTYSILDPKKAAAVAEPLSEFQSFGTTQKRGFQVNMSAALHAPTCHKTPGPGSYNADKPLLRRPPRHPAFAAGDQAPGFASTSVRFSAEKALSPGIGAYDQEDSYSLAASVGKRLVSRNGAFGSAAGRFTTPQVSDAADVPGPVTYSPELAPAGPPRGSRGTSNFRSSTRRFVAPKPPPAKEPKGEVPLIMDTPAHDPTAVGPGTYKTEDLWSPEAVRRRTKRMGNVFISQEQRFGGNLPPGARKTVAPGPGRYSHTRERDAFKPFVRKLGGVAFSSQAPRFRRHMSVAPGPGTYEAADPYGNIVKRSFNVTVDELGFY